MELLTEYLENGYPEKLFYYCLRKTGDVREAEDLASDISLSVIQELSRGVVPQSFSAWVWKIAGNRYARWADKRRKLRENTAELDVSEYDLPDCDSAVDSDMILREQISLMRRELAFISSDYREIVVRYYIENKRVADIAESLDIPEGTVMSKLFRARKILREGMNMAREFGKMSYAPENLFFTMNGMRSENGAPWCYLEKWMEDRLSAYRLIRRGEGGLEPTFLLIKESKKLTEEKQAEYDELEKCAEELMMKHYLYCRELVKNEIPEPLKNNVNQIEQACGDLFCLREAVLDEALRGGLLALPEDEGRRDVLGARLEM